MSVVKFLFFGLLRILRLERKQRYILHERLQSFLNHVKIGIQRLHVHIGCLVRRVLVEEHSQLHVSVQDIQCFQQTVVNLLKLGVVEALAHVRLHEFVIAFDATDACVKSVKFILVDKSTKAFQGLAYVLFGCNDIPYLL